MKSAKKLPRLFAIVALLVIVAVIADAVSKFNEYLRTPLAIVEMQNLDVPKGGTFGQVLRELSARQLLQHRILLQIYARISARGHRIQAGEYLLGPGTTPLDLLDILEQGHVRTHAITMVEGWTLAQMRSALAKDAYLQKLVADVSAADLLHALGIDPEAGRASEGLFFPDTYVFSGATSDRDILRQSYRRMQETLAQEWQARAPDLPYQTSYEALTMASIVERETGAASERPDIAGVFVRRLQRNMLLQTDPAVIYGLGEEFDGNLRRRDLENPDNPYNTYQRSGLPPTPIALPGRAAIHAALQPSAGDALYFVARGNGSHQFSATLEEHEKAVKKFQIEQRRANYQSRPQK
jgi:UPF0755 protein